MGIVLLSVRGSKNSHRPPAIGPYRSAGVRTRSGRAVRL